MNNEHIHDELKDLSPRLSDLKAKGDPHKIPEDYFDSLDARIFSRLDAEGIRVPAPHTRSFMQVWLSPARLSAVAAALALLLVAFWWLKPKEAPEMAQLPVTAPIEEAFTPEMAEEYVKSNIDDFDDDMLTANLEEELDLSMQKTEPESKQKKQAKDELDAILNDLTEEELEDLL